MTLPNGVLIEYVYDSASRLTEITYKQNGTTVLGNLTYEYDKYGNRTKIGGSFARTGIPQAVSSTAYNAANHQTTFANSALTYDNNGNVQTITDPSGTTTYTWNARNQLVAISGPSMNASFVYDGLGRRQKKTINSNLTESLYDGVNPVQETSGAAVLANILPGLGIDEFLSRTDVVAGTTSHLLADALGSSIALTDASGAVQTDYTFEPFGRTTTGGASNNNPYQFTSRENDGTGLYYYRARYYQTGLQRFISEDPVDVVRINMFGTILPLTRRFSRALLLYVPGVTAYTYVRNNPLSFVDPFGGHHDTRPGRPNFDPGHGGHSGQPPPSENPFGHPYDPTRPNTGPTFGETIIEGIINFFKEYFKNPNNPTDPRTPNKPPTKSDEDNWY